MAVEKRSLGAARLVLDAAQMAAVEDALNAWQLPHGSKNPKLVILSPDGSQHKVDLGPLPPP